MARLIKKGHVDGPPESEPALAPRGSIIDREVYEAKADAQQILGKAQAQAEALLTQAQEQAQRLLTHAQEEAQRLKQEAHQLGYAEGKDQGAAELSEVVLRCGERMRHIEEQVVPQLQELSIKIARKILGKELEFHPDSIASIVKQALSEKARQRREVMLRVNPEDLSVLREHRAELVEVLSRCKEIGFREDPEVARHGVIIDTDAGTIDAQLETQLAVFKRMFKDVG